MQKLKAFMKTFKYVMQYFQFLFHFTITIKSLEAVMEIGITILDFWPIFILVYTIHRTFVSDIKWWLSKIKGTMRKYACVSFFNWDRVFVAICCMAGCSYELSFPPRSVSRYIPSFKISLSSLSEHNHWCLFVRVLFRTNSTTI